MLTTPKIYTCQQLPRSTSRLNLTPLYISHGHSIYKLHPNFTHRISLVGILAASVDFASAVCAYTKLQTSHLNAAPAASVGITFAICTLTRLIAVWHITAPAAVSYTSTTGTLAQLLTAVLIAAPAASVGIAFTTCTLPQLIAVWHITAPATTMGIAFSTWATA